MKKFLSGVLCLSMLMGMSTMVFAADSKEYESTATLDAATLVFSVTVPQSLGIEVDASGVVYTADEFTIENKSGGQIVVDNITVTADNDWTIMEYGTDFSTRSVGAKEFTLALMGDEVDTDGSVSLGSDWDAIPAFDGELTMTYSADVASQSTAIETNIATIEFTFDWDYAE